MRQPGDKSVRQLGAGMIVLGWAMALLLLFWVFDSLLAHRANPNNAASVQDQSENSELILQANYNNQYVATGQLSGVPADFLLDTGATLVAVPFPLAQAAGLELGRSVSVETASGVAEARLTTIPEIEIGPLLFRDVSAVAIEGLGGQVLLGMNALADLTIIQQGSQLILRQ